MIAINMKMPEKCSECWFETPRGFCCAKCPEFAGHTEIDGKPDWCPLIPVAQTNPKAYFTEDYIRRKGEDFVLGSAKEGLKHMMMNNIASTPGYIHWETGVDKERQERWMSAKIRVVRIEDGGDE